jgi:uncharacterized membrane protein
MKTQVNDKQFLTDFEQAELAIEVLQLLNGLSVGALSSVLVLAKALSASYARHDCTTAWFQAGVEAHRKLGER